MIRRSPDLLGIFMGATLLLLIVVPWTIGIATIEVFMDSRNIPVSLILQSVQDQYELAAGRAFAERDTPKALQMRQAADDVAALAAQLPPLTMPLGALPGVSTPRSAP